MPGIRVLLLADTHLGFDLPVRPRVERRRRGHDFLANYARALAPALAGEVDIVVHGGDVFDRSRVVPTVAFQAFEPLRAVADRGIPVFIVPGNHERSRLPHLRFAQHPNIHVFDRPRTWIAEVRGARIALAGFPYEKEVRSRFADVLAGTGWRDERADVRLLCVHHCVEGATVGPADYRFTSAPDVIRIRDIPREFAAAFSGHIHRHQVLTTDLARRPVPVPVMYPGSIERTALAEIGEPKGFMLVHVTPGAAAPAVRWEFRALPARPMIREAIVVDGLTAAQLAETVGRIVASVPADAVVSIRLTGEPTAAHWRAVSPARLRAIAPATMNVDITTPRDFPERRRAAGAPSVSAGEPQLGFFDG